MFEDFKSRQVVRVRIPIILYHVKRCIELHEFPRKGLLVLVTKSLKCLQMYVHLPLKDG